MRPVRFAFRDRKAVEALLHLVAGLPEGTSARVVARAVYRAERAHLAKAGRPILCDSYLAMPAGPEPVMVGALLRGDLSLWPDPEAVLSALSPAPGSYLAPRPLRNADLHLLSRSDVDCLDEAAAQCLAQRYKAAEVTQRDRAWREAAPLGPMDWGAMLDPDDPDHAERLDHLRMISVYGLI